MVNPDPDFEAFKSALLQGSINHFSQNEQLFLIIKGILYSIKENPTPDNILLLNQAVLYNSFPEIAALCLETLADLGSKGIQDAIEILYNLANDYQNDQAGQLLLKNHFISLIPWKMLLFELLSSPDTVSINPNVISLMTDGYIASNLDTRKRFLKSIETLSLNNLKLIIDTIIDHNPDRQLAFEDAFPIFSPEEKRLVFQILEKQIPRQDTLITGIICGLFILYEDDQALSMASNHHLTPADPIQKAAFLFLSAQWDEYLRFDFNRSMICTAYEKAPDPVRKRLLKLSRQSGINDWLSNLSQGSQARWINDMTVADWSDTIHASKKTLQWDELWKLGLSAPPYWARQILNTLADSAWQPQEDRESFNALIRLSQETDSILEINTAFELDAKEKSIISLAYHDTSNFLAAGTKDQDILLWDLGKPATPARLLQGPVALSRTLAFDPFGEHLVVVNIDNVIRIYHLPEGKLIKTLVGHNNLVRSIAIHPDGRTLFSADFEGRIYSWRFPLGVQISHVQACKGEIYSIVLAPDGETIFSAGACGHIHAWNWKTWREIKKIDAGQSTVTSLCVSQNTPNLIFYNSDHKMTVWNYETEKTLQQISFPSGSPMFTSMITLSSSNYFINGTHSGKIELRSVETGTILAASNTSGLPSTITSLTLSHDEKNAFSSNLDGKINNWDLIPSLSITTPVKIMTNQQFELSQYKLKTSNSKNEKKWLELVNSLVQWHRRFDIYISKDQPVSIGKFDIFL